MEIAKYLSTLVAVLASATVIAMCHAIAWKSTLWLQKKTKSTYEE
jgi:hypothetical protein